MSNITPNTALEALKSLARDIDPIDLGRIARRIERRYDTGEFTLDDVEAALQVSEADGLVRHVIVEPYGTDLGWAVTEKGFEA